MNTYERSKAAVTEPRNIRRVLSASTLAGDPVVNEKREDLGKIDEIMIDTVSGEVAYAVLSFGGFLGMGDKLFAVPWKALSLDQENKQFVLNVPKEKLKNAPGFDKNDWPDMSETDWGNRVHRYYGIEYKVY